MPSFHRGCGRTWKVTARRRSTSPTPSSQVGTPEEARRVSLLAVGRALDGRAAHGSITVGSAGTSTVLVARAHVVDADLAPAQHEDVVNYIHDREVGDPATTRRPV
jgi:hypothetical protein